MTLAIHFRCIKLSPEREKVSFKKIGDKILSYKLFLEMSPILLKVACSSFSYG